MIIFWTGIALFTLIIIVGLSVPLSAYWHEQTQRRQQLNIQLYQQQMHYQPSPQLATELSQRLLSDNDLLTQTTQKLELKPNKSFFSLILIAVLLLALPLLYYFFLPRYEYVTTGEIQAQQMAQQRAQASTMQKNDDYIEGIQDKLRANPNDGEAWYELGQAYMLNNEFEHALQAYQRTEYLLGSKAYVLGAAATAFYYQAGQKMTPKVQQLVDAALQQDPQETASLSLLASDSFLHADYSKALSIWQQLLDTGRSSIDRRTIIQSMQMAETLRQAQKH